MTTVDQNKIYLDHNACTPLRACARDAMMDCLELTGNPSSVHQFGRAVRWKIETARQSIADRLECPPNTIIFTSGGTEANNLAVRGIPSNTTVLTSCIEHDSIGQSTSQAHFIEVTPKGDVNLSHLESQLGYLKPPVLVSVMFANNETGVVQPIRDIVDVAQRQGAWVHCDASQGVGKLPFSFKDLGVDMMTLSSPKIGGPLGMGALIIKSSIPLHPLLMGGGQERGLRSGTENPANICGFAAALNEAMESPLLHLRPWHQELEQRILEYAPDAKIVGIDALRTGNTSAIFMPNVAAERQVMEFDLHGIAVSTGAACSSGKIKPSHVLKAMRYSEEEIQNTIRVSSGWTTQKSDFDAFFSVWKNLYDDHLIKKAS